MYLFYFIAFLLIAFHLLGNKMHKKSQALTHAQAAQLVELRTTSLPHPSKGGEEEHDSKKRGGALFLSLNSSGPPPSPIPPRGGGGGAWQQEERRGIVFFSLNNKI